MSKCRGGCSPPPRNSGSGRPGPGLAADSAAASAASAKQLVRGGLQGSSSKGSKQMGQTAKGRKRPAMSRCKRCCVEACSAVCPLHQCLFVTFPAVVVAAGVNL